LGSGRLEAQAEPMAERGLAYAKGTPSGRQRTRTYYGYAATMMTWERGVVLTEHGALSSCCCRFHATGGRRFREWPAGAERDRKVAAWQPVGHAIGGLRIRMCGAASLGGRLGRREVGDLCAESGSAPAHQSV
jgi:hypothetical protein